MPHDPSKPFLRLNDPIPAIKRRGGGGGGDKRSFDRDEQIANHGPVFRKLRDVLDGDDAALELRSDPQSLAPERLLVLEVTGSIQNFANAVRRIAGLEFTGEEEAAADANDKNPEVYLLVPQLAALREIVSLWERWVETGSVPNGYSPWRDVFLHLKQIRPWGPHDRVSPRNRAHFEAVVDGAPDDFLVRIEIELVFRQTANARAQLERVAGDAIAAAGGRVIHRAEYYSFAYHALLADVPAREIRRIAALDPNSLAGDVLP